MTRIHNLNEIRYPDCISTFKVKRYIKTTSTCKFPDKISECFEFPKVRKSFEILSDEYGDDQVTFVQ